MDNLINATEYGSSTQRLLHLRGLRGPPAPVAVDTAPVEPLRVQDQPAGLRPAEPAHRRATTRKSGTTARDPLMTAYLVRRIGQAVAVVIGVMVLTFVLIHLEPGSAARAALGVRATASRIAIFNSTYGLNEPLDRQFVTYLDQVAHGNLGHVVLASAAGVDADRPAAAARLPAARAVDRAGPADRAAARDLPGRAAQRPRGLRAAPGSRSRCTRCRTSSSPSC